MIYRMAYNGCEGFHIQTTGPIGHSPPLTWDSFNAAWLAACYSHSAVFGGYYIVLDENGQAVYSTKGLPHDWEPESDKYGRVIYPLDERRQ